MASSLGSIRPLQHYRPRSTSFGSSSGHFSGGWPSASDFSIGTSGPTAQQLFAQAMAKKLKPHRSFWGNVKHAGDAGILHPVEWGFDKLLRVNYGLAAGASAALGRDAARQKRGEKDSFSQAPGDIGAFFHGFARGFKGKEKHGFSKTLEDFGGPFFKKHKIVRGITGLGVDILSDPLTYVSFGSAGVAHAGEEAAFKAGNRLLGLGPKAIMEANAPKVHELDHMINTLNQAGAHYGARQALAASYKAATEAKDAGQLNTAHLAAIDMASDAASAERVANSLRLPQIKIKMGAIKGETPTHILGRKIVPTLGPRGSFITKVIDRQVPVVSGVIGGLRKGFGAGHGDVIRKLRVAQRHVSEKSATHLIHTAQQFALAMPKLKDEQIIDALSFFEKKGSVVKLTDKAGNVDYKINPQRVNAARKAGLSDDQIKFVNQWHGWGQTLHHMDKAFGVEYEHLGEQGKLYVPHLVDREGIPFTRKQLDVLKTFGFQKGRTGRDLSLGMLKKLRDNGELPRGIVDNPFEIMAHMATTRAVAYGQHTAADVMAKGWGTASKVYDHGVINTKRRQLEKLQGRINEATKRSLESQSVVHRLRDSRGADELVGREMDRIKNYEKVIQGFHKQEQGLAKELDKLMEGSKNPALKGGHFSEIPGHKVTDDFGNDVVFDPEMAQAIGRYKTLIDPTEDETLKALQRVWVSSMAKWKLGVTAINPGYRIRNTVTDFANMWLDGVPMHAMPVASKRAANMLRTVKKLGDGKITNPKELDNALSAFRELDRLYNTGVLAGQFGGDMNTLAQMLRHSGSKTALLKNKRFLRLMAKVAHDVNRNAENWGRLTHYMYRTRVEKMGFADAVQHVKNAHFDYEDLTELERQKIKGMLMPFYTWTRKNLAFQLKTLATRPGRMTFYPKLAMESTQVSGGDHGIVPDYIGRGFGFKVPVGHNNYLNTASMLGVGSLQFVRSPKDALQQTALMVNPFLKTPAELYLNRSFLTGQDIADPTGHPRTPVTGLAGKLMSLLPGANVGTTSRLVNGKRVYGTGADPRWAYALSQIPMSRLFIQNLSGQKPGHTNALVSWLGGASTSHVDPQQQRTIAELQFQDQLKKYIKGLRDEGKYPQAVPHVSKNQRKLNNQIAFRLGG
jgi:hypothetical protein